MISDLIPVLWLCGPPGIGKTTVGWEIFTQLTQAGIEAGYVDIDQLGICYPEPASDPGRHRMKERNLGAVVATYRAAGARCVIVSGVVDPGRGVRAGLIPRAAVTVCRLRAGRDELRQRFLRRGGQVGQLDEVLSQAGALDASDVADVCVDTSGVAAAEAARLVRERIAGWPILTGPGRPDEARPDDRPATTADGPVLVLCGATGVGKSTAGFEVYRRTLRAGSAAAYVDLDQIGFCRSVAAGEGGGHRVRTRNLAAIWHTYRAAGAQCLIAAGPVESEAAAQAYADALPCAAVTLCRLHAGAGELTRRIMLRGHGGSWPQPGDPLAGQPPAYLRRAAASAAAEAEALERAVTGALRIDTDGLTVEETADLIAARTRWPKPADLRRSRVGRLAAMPADDLPVAEFAFPGPLRDQLVGAILAGEKTTTTGLVADYEHENEPLPGPGLRQAVVDSAGRPVAVIETTAVRVIRLADVDLDHALGEGEGYTSVAEWRVGHEQFWHSAELRQALGDPGFTVGDDTLVVAQEFRLIAD